MRDKFVNGPGAELRGFRVQGRPIGLQTWAARLRGARRIKWLATIDQIEAAKAKGGRV